MSAKLKAIMAEIATIFLEREDQIQAVMRALLAELHVLLLGPPGTAKSAVIVERRALSRWVIRRRIQA